MRKDYGKDFCETDKSSPLYGNTLDCIGTLSDLLGKTYPCDDIYRYWVFRNYNSPEVKYYAFMDLGNGWWAGRYFEADDLIQLWNELKAEAQNE